jgi:DNA polymerase-3 subunit alpha
MLDGLATPKEYAKRAAALGQPALALTDHGNLYLAPVHYKACREADVEPLLGFEGYFVRDAQAVRAEKDAERSHITILARGGKGYSLLSEFNTATQQQFYYKPLVDRPLCEALGDDAKHFTVLSGCAGSQLSRHLLAGDEEAAVEELMWWRETFPHYYIEIMHHGTDFDMKLNEQLLGLAQRYDVPWVVTNDPHYCVKEDAPHHDVLLAIQMGRDIDDPDRMRFDGSGYWLKSRAEMYSTFRRAGYDPLVFKIGAHNALAIAKESRTRVKMWESKTWQIPKYPDTDDSFALLKRMVYRGMRARGHRDDPERLALVRHELRVIRDVGIADFLLITWDAIYNGAIAKGARVGPGRGSVAGSIVGYYLGIHKIDPVKYKLRFDRFLNPARPKMPDIDTDFQMTRRHEAIQYVIDKYGEENTMAVCQFGTMKVKAAFNSISKAFGIGYADAQRLNKLILEEDDDDGSPQYVLPKEITNRYPELSSHLHRLAGLKRTIGAHPAGLIIADPSANIRKQVPLMWQASSKRWVGQFDKKAVEGMGLMKQDFLGLRTLDTIAECLKILKWRRGIEFDPDEWVPDEEPGDRKVYKMLAEGKTSGVFQMEGPVNQRGCRDVRPKSFEDLVSITSLYRTGPIAAGYPGQFIANRRGGVDSIQYLHPKLKPILEPTWGVILYQEQVMDIGEKLAGFDGVLVDEIKEAIKDKSSEEMERVRPLFIEGCKRHSGIGSRTATAIWDIIAGYAGYGYNRSHAVAYTMLTYQTARLKYLYPIEFHTALLRTVPNDKDNADKRDRYLRAAIEEGKAKIWPPDINASDYKAWPDREEDAIRFGLSDLKGVGEKTALKVVQRRPAGGYQDYVAVADVVNNTKMMQVLGDGMALGPVGVVGKEEKAEKLLNWTFQDPMEEYRDDYKHWVVFPPSRDVRLVGMIYAVQYGTTKTDPPKPYRTWKIRWSVTKAFDIRMWSGCESLWHLRPGSVVKLEGEWEQRWENVTLASPHRVEILHEVTEPR